MAGKNRLKKDGGTDASPRGTRPFDQRMQKEIVSTAQSLAEPLCASEGLELIHVEFQREPGGRVLRLYIDRPGGVSIDDCAAVSRQMSDLLDLKLDTEIAYVLEVSSPGLNRPLSRLSDFEKFTGETARIRTAIPINGQKNFKGALSGVMDDHIRLQIEAETVLIPFREISKARLCQ